MDTKRPAGPGPRHTTRTPQERLVWSYRRSQNRISRFWRIPPHGRGRESTLSGISLTIRTGLRDLLDRTDELHESIRNVGQDKEEERRRVVSALDSHANAINDYLERGQAESNPYRRARLYESAAHLLRLASILGEEIEHGNEVSARTDARYRAN